jgi:hypothetical protein
MTTMEAALVRGVATYPKVDGTVQLATCRCGQDLDISPHEHCPRCGTCVTPHQ